LHLRQEARYVGRDLFVGAGDLVAARVWADAVDDARLGEGRLGDLQPARVEGRQLATVDQLQRGNKQALLVDVDRERVHRSRRRPAHVRPVTLCRGECNNFVGPENGADEGHVGKVGPSAVRVIVDAYVARYVARLHVD